MKVSSLRCYYQVPTWKAPVMLARLPLPDTSRDWPTVVREPREAPLSAGNAAFPFTASAPRIVDSAANAPVRLVSSALDCITMASSTCCSACQASHFQMSGLQLNKRVRNIKEMQRLRPLQGVFSKQHMFGQSTKKFRMRQLQQICYLVGRTQMLGACAILSLP